MSSSIWEQVWAGTPSVEHINEDIVFSLGSLLQAAAQKSLLKQEMIIPFFV